MSLQILEKVRKIQNRSIENICKEGSKIFLSLNVVDGKRRL